MSTSGHAPVVLLVQRPNDDLEMYVEFLAHKGLRPFAVSTAADALAAAAEADIIVTGVRLDGDVTGLELVARLRADDRTKHKPVIVLTASAWRVEHDRAQKAGCDLFLPKPCLPGDLLRHVRLLLASAKHRRKRRSAKADVRNRSVDRTQRPRNRGA
jgi:DNA-binding response OmpR family regulator